MFAAAVGTGERDTRPCFAGRRAWYRGRTEADCLRRSGTMLTLGQRIGDRMAHPQERAWCEGNKAGKNDRLRASCPYSKGIMQQAWLAGWGEGQKSNNAKDA